MAVKMNLTIIAKNHAADSEIGFLAKSISKFNGCATAKPTTWELSNTQIYMTEIRNEIKKKKRGISGVGILIFKLKISRQNLLLESKFFISQVKNFNVRLEYC